MSRYITVSAIAPSWWSAPTEKNYRQMTENMLAMWQSEIRKVLPERPDLILLPEACDRYTNMSPEQNRAYYDVRGSYIRDGLAEIARENRCYIAYSAAWQYSDGYFRNATQLIGRNGNVEGVYHKNHLVIDEGALDSPIPMLCGREPTVSSLDFGKVGCVICFDLSFPELREKYHRANPELLLFSSNFHGDFLQQIWAYECHSYFVSAVRNQEARILSPVGEVIAHSTNYFPYVTAKINLDFAVCYLDYNWSKLSAARQKYGAKIHVQDPGKTGAVLLTSETEEFSAMEVVREFDMELFDDYFNRSRENRGTRFSEEKLCKRLYK